MYMTTKPQLDEYELNNTHLHDTLVALQRVMELKESNISDLSSEIDSAMAIIDEQENNIASLEIQVAALENDKIEDQRQIEELSSDLDLINQSYIGLQNTLNFHSLSDNSRELIFTLNTSTSGYDENIITFDVGYGILMDVFVSQSSSTYESEIDIELSWRRGDRRGFLVGLGNAQAEGYEVVTVRAYCEIYDESSNQMWIKVGAQIVELPWMEKSRLTTFSIP